MEWLQSIFDGGNSSAIQLVIMTLALVAVIALIVWLFRWLAGFSSKRANRAGKPRLSVVDVAAVDDKRHLVLVRRDNTEHLVMVGGGSDVLIESGIETRNNATQLPATDADSAPGPLATDAQDPALAAKPLASANTDKEVSPVGSDKPHGENSAEVFSNDADGIKSMLQEASTPPNPPGENSVTVSTTPADKAGSTPSIGTSPEVASATQENKPFSSTNAPIPSASEQDKEKQKTVAVSSPSVDDILEQLRKADNKSVEQT